MFSCRIGWGVGSGVGSGVGVGVGVGSGVGVAVGVGSGVGVGVAVGVGVGVAVGFEIAVGIWVAFGVAIALTLDTSLDCKPSVPVTPPQAALDSSKITDIASANNLFITIPLFVKFLFFRYKIISEECQVNERNFYILMLHRVDAKAIWIKKIHFPLDTTPIICYHSYEQVLI